MSVLKSKQEDGNELFRVRISKNVLSELNEVTEEARKKDLEFPTAEIVEEALRKALKAAKVELGLTEGRKRRSNLSTEQAQ